MKRRKVRSYTILSRKEYHTIRKMIRAGVSPTGIKKETGRAYATIKRVDESQSWADYIKNRQGKKYNQYREDEPVEEVLKAWNDPIDDAISREINKARNDAAAWKFFAIALAVLLVVYVIISQIVL